MPRAKRVSAPLLPKAQIKTGRAKRGIAEPVAQVAKKNAPEWRISRELPVGAKVIRSEVTPNGVAHFDVCQILAEVA